MNYKVRFGGAQIPCTRELDQNVDTICKSIDWASENNVDYLVTPEGSLSGYFPDFDCYQGRTRNDLVSALNLVLDHALSKSVGLCLGTMWLEENETGFQRENQIRFYSKTGKFLGKTNKTYIIPEYDRTVANTHIDHINMEDEKQNFHALGLICNDLWGGPPDGMLALPTLATQLNSHLIVHSTNGYRGEEPEYDDLMNAWHEGNLRMWSWDIPIITVDNCYYMQGDPYDGPTSSQSGVLVQGKWVTKVPRCGTQHFYYDFDHHDLINYGYKVPFWVKQEGEKL